MPSPVSSTSIVQTNGGSRLVGQQARGALREHGWVEPCVLVRRVERLAALVGLDVHRPAGVDERGHVGDRVADAVPIPAALDVERLVEITGAERVERDERKRRLVGLRQARRARRLLGVGEHLVREVERDLQLAPQLGERRLDLGAVGREAERALGHRASVRRRRSVVARTCRGGEPDCAGGAAPSSSGSLQVQTLQRRRRDDRCRDTQCSAGAPTPHARRRDRARRRRLGGRHAGVQPQLRAGADARRRPGGRARRRRDRRVRAGQRPPGRAAADGPQRRAARGDGGHDPAQDRQAARRRDRRRAAHRPRALGLEVGGGRPARLRARPRRAPRLDARRQRRRATRSAAASAGTRASSVSRRTASSRSSS